MIMVKKKMTTKLIFLWTNVKKLYITFQRVPEQCLPETGALAL